MQHAKFELFKSSFTCPWKSTHDLLALKFEYFNLCSTTAKQTGKLLGVVSLRRSVRFHQGGFKTRSS